MTQPVAPTQQTFDPSTLGSNPWTSVAGGDAATLQSAQAAAGPTATPAPATSSYPAMANSYGLGDTTSNSGAGAGSAVSVNMPDISTRGANPWSLVGESNARGGGPPPTTPLSTQG